MGVHDYCDEFQELGKSARSERLRRVFIIRDVHIDSLVGNFNRWQYNDSRLLTANNDMAMAYDSLSRSL